MGKGEKAQEKPGLREKEEAYGASVDHRKGLRKGLDENGEWGQMRKLQCSKVKLKPTRPDSALGFTPTPVCPQPSSDCCAVLGPAKSHGPAAHGRLAKVM